jgi:hypothetical protein
MDIQTNAESRSISSPTLDSEIIFIGRKETSRIGSFNVTVTQQDEGCKMCAVVMVLISCIAAAFVVATLVVTYYVWSELRLLKNERKPTKSITHDAITCHDNTMNLCDDATFLYGASSRSGSEVLDQQIAQPEDMLEQIAVVVVSRTQSFANIKWPEDEEFRKHRATI